jgi:predicted nucleic acid-binding protein
MYLLDTNVLLELRKSRPDRQVTRWADSVPASHLYLSVISVLELETGVLQVERRDARHGAMLRRWLNEHVLPAFTGRVLAIDTGVVLRCARLHVSDRMAHGDALIAATALVHGLTVVTRNTADFKPAAVELLNPWLALA